MAISGDSYKQIGRAAAGAVSVISAYEGSSDQVVALTVSSFVTLSFDPPLVMFAIQHDASSYQAMATSTAFGVSLLRVEQAHVAKRFAQRGRDKTEGTTFDRGSILRVPLVPDSLAQIECRTDQLFKSGDHAIIVGLVEGARTSEGQPLLYFARQYGSFMALERA